MPSLGQFELKPMCRKSYFVLLNYLLFLLYLFVNKERKKTFILQTVKPTDYLYTMSVPNSVSVNQTNMSLIPNVIRYKDEELGSLKLFEEYPKPMVQFTAVCCMLFMVIGIPGNFITIFALSRYKKVRNATAIFIINLSISDLMYCCINLPFAASTFWTQSWPYGVILCRIFPTFRYALAAVSLFTVVAIPVNRYVMISHPKCYPRIYSTRNIIIMIVSIWIISWTALVPTWLEVWGRFGMNTKTYLCDIIPDQKGSSPVATFFLLAFVVPSATIIFCYGRILWIVRKTSKKSRGKDQNRRSVIESSSFETSTIVERSRETDNETSSYAVEQVKSQRMRFSSNIASIMKSISRSTYIVTLHNNIRENLKPTSKDKRLFSLIMAIILSFFICHLPITIIKVSSAVTKLAPSAYLWSYILRFLTACVNPVIYVVMSKEYRKAYKKTILPKSWKFCER